MTTKTFYRVTLLLSIVLPLLLLPLVNTMAISTILIMSLLFAGVQYILFTILMFYLIGKYHTSHRIKHLLWLSPPIFVVFAIIGWYIKFFINRLSNPALIFSLDMVFVFILYGLLIGYGYCFIIELIYMGFEKLGWIKPMN